MSQPFHSSTDQISTTATTCDFLVVLGVNKELPVESPERVVTKPDGRGASPFPHETHLHLSSPDALIHTELHDSHRPIVRCIHV